MQDLALCDQEIEDRAVQGEVLTQAWNKLQDMKGTLSDNDFTRARVEVRNIPPGAKKDTGVMLLIRVATVPTGKQRFKKQSSRSAEGTTPAGAVGYGRVSARLRFEVVQR